MQCSKRRKVRHKTTRLRLKSYEPRCEKAFNNYIIILISIRLLNIYESILSLYV